MSDLDIPVFPHELRTYLKIKSASTLRDQMKSKKIPAFDVVVTQKTRYWFRSTLVKHGLLPPMEAHAAAPSQPTPAE